MAGSIADVHCPKCGAPAKFDIVRQYYHCAYCGGQVKINEAIASKQGFRSVQQEKIRQSAGQYQLMRANCSGCGAELVFDKNEAITNCAFCGRALVRKDYIASEEIPEMIIPFRITREEAEGLLQEWCGKNAKKPEAKHLQEKIGDLQGFYLPYELIRGPVKCQVSRMDSYRNYHCSGYVDQVFVNCSNQLDNLLLDAMEPFELEDMKVFDFAYAAGQRIKIRDVDSEGLKKRVDQEVSNDYTPVVQKTLETKAVDVNTDPNDTLRMPVLLPVYYLRAGETIAAVNGQTGKISVRAEKESHYYFLPWWLKAVIAAVVIVAVVFAGLMLFGMSRNDSLYVSALLGIVTVIITLCAYSETVRNQFSVESGRKVFTSDGGVMRREGKNLVRSGDKLEKEVTPPVFFEKLDGKVQPVELVFSSLPRRMKTALIAAVVLFFPVILALFVNGFDFGRLELGGSAVWFCIMVPVIPIYILKFSVIELYENPWIYVISEDGSKKRYRGKLDISKDEAKSFVKVALISLIKPPICFAVWFGIACFITMVYLTAFGFD